MIWILCYFDIFSCQIAVKYAKYINANVLG